MQEGGRRTQSEAVWVLSVVFGVAGGAVAAAPTGRSAVDAILCGALVAFVTWAGSSARTWLLLLVSGAFGVVALSRPAVAVIAFAGMAVVGVCDLLGQRRRWIKAIGAGLTGVAGLLLPHVAIFGGSAIVAGVGMAAVCVSGVALKAPRVRRRTVISAAVVAGVGLLAAVGTSATLVAAQRDVDAGDDMIRSALTGLGAGEIESAAPALDAAAQSFAAAEEDLRRPWGWLGSLVPVVAQHRDLALDVASSATSAAETASAALEEVDLDSITMGDGRVDVDAIERLSDPLAAVSNAVDEFEVTLSRRASPWLVGPVSDEIGRVRERVDEEGTRIANLAEATRLVPDMLGGSSQRRLFVAFITPSEARPLGGHMSNYGELTMVDGRLTLSRFGRTGELMDISARSDESRQITGPPAYLDRYGVFGAGGDGVPAASGWWLNVTISPDFPSVAQVINQLYEQGTGREIDGVVAIDPTGLAALLRATGPIEVPSLDTTLTADNVVQFLERDQYELFTLGENEERSDLLEDVARTTFDRLVEGDGVDPVDLVEGLAPAVASGHVMAWSPDPREQALYTAVGAGGGFARQGRRDGLAVTTLNSGGNKLDAFLQRTVRYDAVVDESTGALTGTVTVTLENSAPADGLSDYVIGSSVGDPRGSNRTYTVLYRAGAIDSASVDGEPVEPATGTELGWNYSEWRTTVPAGGSTTLEYHVSGNVDPSAPYELLVRAQPLVQPDRLTVSVTSTSGRQLVAYDGPLERTTLFSEEPATS